MSHVLDSTRRLPGLHVNAKSAIGLHVNCIGLHVTVLGYTYTGAQRNEGGRPREFFFLKSGPKTLDISECPAATAP